MGSNFQWLIMSVEKDDIQIIDAESKMWGDGTLVQKLMKTVGKQAVLYKDNRLRTYLIVKQGTGKMTEELAELRREYGLDSSENPAECAAARTATQLIVDTESNEQATAPITEATTVQSSAVVKVVFCEFCRFVESGSLNLR